MISEIDILRQLGNVPVTTAVLKTLLSDYSNPNAKIKHWVGQGVLVPLKRGLFIVAPEWTQQEPCLELIANHLYSPSYVSLQFALRYYGLIPEQTNMVTSITTRHTRSFENGLGAFSYHGVSRAYFAPGITTHTEGTATYMIATKEKALLDTILLSSYVPARSVVGLERFLAEDLRFDMSALSGFSIPLLESCLAATSKQSTIYNLITLCRR